MILIVYGIKGYTLKKKTVCPKKGQKGKKIEILLTSILWSWYHTESGVDIEIGKYYLKNCSKKVPKS